MDQVIKIYEYTIKTKFNPVKFNNLRYTNVADQTSKVMFKNTSKKTIITVAVILLLIIATIIFIVVKNKKKKKKLEEEARNKPEQLPSKKALRPPSSVIPKEDQPSADKKPAPVASKPAPAAQPAPVNTVPMNQPVAQPTETSEFVNNGTNPKPVNPKAQPQVEHKKMTPLADKGISIEAELNKPLEQD